MILIDDLLRSFAFLGCFDGDRYAMLIRATDVSDVPTLRPEVAHVDIGRDITTCQMTDMERPIGIRECRGDGIAFKIFIAHGVK
jgi:hypothetical protein